MRDALVPVTVSVDGPRTVTLKAPSAEEVRLEGAILQNGEPVPAERLRRVNAKTTIQFECLAGCFGSVEAEVTGEEKAEYALELPQATYFSGAAGPCTPSDFRRSALT